MAPHSSTLAWSQIGDFDLGFVLAAAPLAGTQLIGSKWFSAEVLSMSY